MAEMAEFYLEQEMNAHPDEWFHRTYGPPLKCKHCGATGLYWQTVKGQYRIYEKSTIAQHVCPIRTDDMPNLED
jgi:hypothetical protein